VNDARDPALTSLTSMSTPCDLDAEQAVLSAMLLDGTAAATAVASGTPAMFYRTAHGLIFAAMQRLAAKGSAIDPVTLRAELDATGELDKVGGIEYLATLIDCVPSGAHVADYLRLVADKATRRQLIGNATAILEAAHNGKSLGDLATLLQTTVATITTASVAGTPRWHTLATLMADPEASAPPVAVIPNLAFKARTSLLAAREKDGKSTFASAGVAAVTRGRPFLGQPTTAGSVLWLAAEEHPNDLGQRATLFETDLDRVTVLTRCDDLFADLKAAIAATRPVLLVVDTLATATTGLVDDPHSSTAWTPVMVQFTALARDHDLAVLLLAHSRKSDGAYRDSTAIGAGVDVILEMSTPLDDTVARFIKARARWAMTPFTVRRTGHGYDLSGGELSTDARVLLHIEREPGLSKQRLREAVGGRAADVDMALRGLLYRKVVVEVPGPRGAKLLYPAKDAPPDLTSSQPENRDEVPDEVVTPSRDPVPTSAHNDLAPDEVARSSQFLTLGGQPGRGQDHGDAWEPTEAVP
jgi:hypothetical protein